MPETQGVKLQFSVDGKEQLDQLKASEAAAKSGANDLAAALDHGEEAAALYAAELRDLAQAEAGATKASRGLEDAARDEARAMDDAARASERAASGAGKVTRATGDAGKGAKQAQQGFLDLSRAASDWATGGFLGVVNNLEGIGRAIPALLKNPMAFLSGLPAILTAVGTAVYLFGGQVYDGFRRFALGANEVPKATDALGKLDERIKDVGKTLDDYRSKQYLTNAELKEYNRLSEEQIRLEEQKVKALETAARMKKFNEDNPGKTADEAERAGMFADTLGTPELRKELSGSVYEALDKTRKATAEAALKRARAEQKAEEQKGILGHPELAARNVAEAQAKVATEEKALRDTANRLASQATIGGDKAATDRIAEMQRQRPDAFTDYQKYAIENADPARKRAEERAIEDQRQRHKDLKDKLDKDTGRGNAAADDEDAMIDAMSDEAARDLDRKTDAAKVKATRDEADRKQREADNRDAIARQAADRKELESGLGDDFIAAAERRRLEVAAVKDKDQRQAAEAKFDTQARSSAYRAMVGKGIDPGRAEELSRGVGAFIEQDIQRQLNTLRAQNPGATAGQARDALHAGLGANLQNRALAAQEKTLGVAAALTNNQAGMAARMDRIESVLSQLVPGVKDVQRRLQPGQRAATKIR